MYKNEMHMPKNDFRIWWVLGDYPIPKVYSIHVTLGRRPSPQTQDFNNLSC